MKIAVHDTLFARLFFLLFFVLYLSSFASRQIVDALGLKPANPAPPFDPFSLRVFIFRILASASTAWVAARWLVNPISRMAMAANELGKNVNAAAIDETSGPAEVRQASKVFNQMQTRIKRQLEERDRFLAAVSHDLRTPLTRLKLRAEKIEQQALQSDVQNDINEMTGIIESTLDYLRGGEQSEETCLLDIDALVQSMAEDVIEGGGDVTVVGSAGPIELQPIAIRRCLNNLIENALRYGEKAVIDISETDDKVVIAIRDSGPGIPVGQLEAVFAPFFRLEESRNRYSGGVGLGLSIARDMVRKQGGDVVLKNAPEGGLVATLVLPRRHKL